MAITKIHPIKATLNKSVAYICNPDKTDGQILISSFSCSPETAEYDFKFALSKTKSSDPNLAFHLIQSFAPGEVSFEEAHAIGVELADQLLQNKYSYIVATHIDKDHCHNHVIFCAADNVDYRKYHDCKATYRNIRRINDRLCQEHNLSVITPGQDHGVEHNEWEAKKTRTSWKEKMRQDINEAIAQSSSYEVFIELMKAKGYEIKGEDFGDKAAKYISFRPADKERFVRGSAKSLGAEFTKERIRERIQEQNLARKHEEIEKKHPIPIRSADELLSQTQKQTDRRTTIIAQTGSVPQSLIQISEDKLQQSPFLRQWQERQNLKIAAHAFAASESIAELETTISVQSGIAKTLRSDIAALDREIKNLKEIIYYADRYAETLPIEKRYQSAKNKELFEQKHHTKLRLHEGACAMLQKHGIRLTKALSPVKFEEQLNRKLEEKAQLQKTQKSAETACHEAEQKLQIINEYLSENEHPLSLRPISPLLVVE